MPVRSTIMALATLPAPAVRRPARVIATELKLLMAVQLAPEVSKFEASTQGFAAPAQGLAWEKLPLPLMFVPSVFICIPHPKPVIFAPGLTVSVV